MKRHLNIILLLLTMAAAAGACTSLNKQHNGDEPVMAEGYVRHVILWTLSEELSPDQKLDVILYFENRKALEDFSVNPDHLAVVSQLKPFITGRTCLDIELQPYISR